MHACTHTHTLSLFISPLSLSLSLSLLLESFTALVLQTVGISYEKEKEIQSVILSQLS